MQTNKRQQMDSDSDTDKSDHTSSIDSVRNNTTSIDNIFNSVNDIKKIDEAIRKKPNIVNERDGEGNTLLIIACTYGNCELVRYLLASLLYVNIDHKNDYGESALQISEVFGHPEIAKIIKFYKSKNVHSSTRDVILCQ